MKRGEGMVSGNGQVGAFIAERRKAKGWSQKDLAGVLQVTDKAVSRWERGAGYPDVTLLKPLALALENGWRMPERRKRGCSRRWNIR